VVGFPPIHASLSLTTQPAAIASTARNTTHAQLAKTTANATLAATGKTAIHASLAQVTSASVLAQAVAIVRAHLVKTTDAAILHATGRVISGIGANLNIVCQPATVQAWGISAKAIIITPSVIIDLIAIAQQAHIDLQVTTNGVGIQRTPITSTAMLKVAYTGDTVKIEEMVLA
jgi:hypothetical protein